MIAKDARRPDQVRRVEGRPPGRRDRFGDGGLTPLIGPMDKATFDRMHAVDRMANDKLKEGIEGFSAALVKLETLLAKRLAELESRTPAAV